MGPCTPPQARSPSQKVKSQRWPTQEAKASVQQHRSPRRRWLQARLVLASGRKLPEPPPCCSLPRGSWRLQGLTVSGASRSLGPILVHVEVTLGGDRRATTHPRPGCDPAGVRPSVKSRASELPEPALVTRKGGFLRIPKGGLWGSRARFGCWCGELVPEPESGAGGGTSGWPMSPQQSW